jgi:hypothetical protein
VNPATPFKLCGNSKGVGCGQSLPLTDFHRLKTAPDGRHSLCKTCRCEIEQARYAEKADEIVAYKARVYAAHRDEILAKQRETWPTRGPKWNAHKREKRGYARKERRDRPA